MEKDFRAANAPTCERISRRRDEADPQHEEATKVILVLPQGKNFVAAFF
ncbi:MAG: hypothetical protein H0X13_10765 [Ramlibacter sp.]|nr:hypothetical protein [Ramlibacter sp.]